MISVLCYVNIFWRNIIKHSLIYIVLEATENYI